MELAAGDKRPRDEANTPGQSVHDLRFDERPRLGLLDDVVARQRLHLARLRLRALLGDPALLAQLRVKSFRERPELATLGARRVWSLWVDPSG